ncbi:alpha/beta hydrolase [Allorhizobium terrae]|uniref:Alpha/beta hydrolase n=2 Tax=Allorhizobium terrae TaxID=1848972 RepID=A0A4S4A1J3_9HYPH|nr:alpha/beta hydrolase [Allorhizobium terrae]
MMFGRRLFMTLLAVSPFVKAFANPSSVNAVPLWPAEPPGGGGPAGNAQANPNKPVTNVAIPTLRMVRPEKPNGTAVLIAPGGGYRFISEKHEGEAAAKWLAARGITAFILTYRLPGEGWMAGPLAPLQDAQRALRMIRFQAASLGLDEKKIGCMGFSAGGHLMGMLSTRFQQNSYQPLDTIDTASSRPDFSILAYPVITLKPPYDHTWTRMMLVGRHPTAEAEAEWSVDAQVKAGDPPFLLVHAKDDPVAKFPNALIMQAACEKAGVPVELIALEKGGHGFGMGLSKMGMSEKDPVVWTPGLEDWLRKRGLLSL